VIGELKIIIIVMESRTVEGNLLTMSSQWL